MLAWYERPGPTWIVVSTLCSVTLIIVLSETVFAPLIAEHAWFGSVLAMGVGCLCAGTTLLVFKTRSWIDRRRGAATRLDALGDARDLGAIAGSAGSVEFAESAEPAESVEPDEPVEPTGRR